MPLLDEARALLVEATTRVRPRDRGRGAGPDADAAADDRAPRAGWLGDRPRRHRAGDGARRRTGAGASCCRTCPLVRRDAAVEELRYAYRVPREIMELALPLARADRARRRGSGRLPVGRAGGPVLKTDAPIPRRSFPDGGGARLSAQDGLLAVIAPADVVADAEGAVSRSTTGIPLLTPRDAKGLEFDHVIVVEPAQIAEERSRARACEASTSRSRARRRRGGGPCATPAPAARARRSLVPRRG